MTVKAWVVMSSRLDDHIGSHDTEREARADADRCGGCYVISREEYLRRPVNEVYDLVTALYKRLSPTIFSRMTETQREGVRELYSNIEELIH